MAEKRCKKGIRKIIKKSPEELMPVMGNVTFSLSSSKQGIGEFDC
jgi:hypothetical protein